MDILKSFRAVVFDNMVKLLDKRGFSVLSPEQLSATQKLYQKIGDIENSSELISIVFSKDRAMQLNAFLESYFEKVSNPSAMEVIYKASSPAHKQSYDELSSMYADKGVAFVEEVSFREQLIDIIKSSVANRVVFYVDDMVFTHEFDYSALYDVNTFENILSFSRGKDLTYSTVLERELTLPTFEKSGQFMSFNWDELKEFSDWTYPIGVSGYMYGKDELLIMLNNIDFKAPNSLESAMNVYIHVFKQRKGLCMANTISVCVHDNLTQTEVSNPVLGNYTTDELLEKWNSGQKIKVDLFYDKPATVAQELVYDFLDR